jgi:hypothetical protein
MVDLASIDMVTFQIWDGSTWVDWTGSVASISIQRGGGVVVDVGSITVVLVRDDDPLADESIVPGQSVRVVKAGTSNPIFTGAVRDAGVGIIRDDGGTTRNAITIVADDAVASHQKNTRYGAVTDGGVGHETFVARVTRLATSSETPVSLPSEPDPALPWECQDVAYVSSLASHFDLACQTVGANWYVDSGNVTRFRLPDDATSSVGTFSDQIDDANQYDDITIDSGTKQVVNVLKITNHGRGDDGNTYDIAATFEDTDSVTEWGARAASTDMCVWDADTNLSGRAEVVFDDFGAPVREVSQVVWDGQQNPTLAAALDIQSPVTVRFGSETFDTRIVELKHDITPSSWTITIGTSTRGVPDSQAVNDAYSTTSATGAEPINRDARAPQAPTGLTVSPFAAWQGGDVVLALQGEWEAVTLGDNGAPIGVSLYEMWARPDDGATPTKLIGTSIGTALAVSRPEFAVGDTWLVKVRAWSDNNVVGPFCDEVSATLAEPTEELDVPTDPNVSALPGLGLAMWDGDLATDPVSSAPESLAWILVETSDDVDAPDDEWSAVKTLYVAGDTALIAQPVGWEGFVRFRAVDRVGRVTDPSNAIALTIPAADGSFLDVSAVITSLVSAGIAGLLDLSANDSIELLAGRIDETQSVFRVTPDGAEVRQTGVTSYIQLTAEALNLYGPTGDIGAQVTAQGLEAPTVIATASMQVAEFGWSVSSDGHHLTLRKVS